MRISVDLPAPFGPSSPKDFAVFYRETEMVHGAEIAETLRQIVDLDVKADFHFFTKVNTVYVAFLDINPDPEIVRVDQ
jgi:hypothetical protein